MAKKDLNYDSTNCSGGINQNLDRIQRNQCADALNVYAPNGTVIQRPGYLGMSVVLDLNDITGTIESNDGRLEDNSGATPSYTTITGGSDIGGAVAQTALRRGDRLYFGWTQIYEASIAAYGQVLLVGVTTANGNTATKTIAEYWDGTSWRLFPVTDAPVDINQTYFPYNGFLTYARPTYVHLYTFATPKGWALSTVDGAERYWMRFELLDTDLSAAVVFDAGLGDFSLVGQSDILSMSGIFAAQFASTKRYFAIRADNKNGTLIFNSAAMMYQDLYQYRRSESTQGIPATMAVVPDFNEAYIAFNREVTVHKARPAADDDVEAKVEDRDFAVGTGAPWDKDSIMQLSGWPSAKFIGFFQNRLWVVDDNDILRWSAALPYHRVWPSLAFASLTEDDNSPVSGFAQLDEAPVIYKNNSILIASYTHTDAFDIPHFVVRKVISGIGSVAHATIQSIKGTHVFLSEDGVQQFDGVDIRKPSEQRVGDVTIDRLRNFWPRISSGRRAYAAAGHWKEKNLYLLAVPVDGSDVNNMVVVWDYQDDTWWLWDNIDAQFFLSDEGQYDEETFFFVDALGNIYQMGVGDDDYGVAINAHVTTRRLSYKDGTRETLRVVDIMSENATDKLDVTISRNGTPMNNAVQSAAIVDFADRNETIYGDAMGSDFSWHMEREASLYQRIEANHVQVKVGTARKGRPLYLSRVAAGFNKLRRNR